MGTKNSTKTLTTVEKAFRIVEALKSSDGAGVTELAEQLDMSKSTVHIHLQTLEQRGYVTSNHGKYELSLQFLNLGEYVKQAHPLYEVAQPVVEELAEETGEWVGCAVEQHGVGTFLCISRGERALKTRAHLGAHMYLHLNAQGKAILAHLPEERIDEVLNCRGLPKFTANTITDRTQILEELEEGRERGLFFGNGGFRSGIASVGAPLLGEDKVYGSLGIFGPERRMKEDYLDPNITDQLLVAANTIEVNMDSP